MAPSIATRSALWDDARECNSCANSGSLPQDISKLTALTYLYVPSHKREWFHHPDLAVDIEHESQEKKVTNVSNQELNRF